MSDLGIDATHWISGKDIYDAGYRFVGRYCLEGLYRITPEECQDYLNSRLAIELFGEHQANFMLGGGPAGTSAGADAANYLFNVLKAPAGTAVYFTVDFEANAAQMPTLGAFLSAAAVQLAGAQYQCGVYGSYDVTEAFYREFLTHQTEAWSYGRVSEHANFYQRVGTTLPPIAGTQPGSYDEDIAINPQGLWTNALPPPPPPITVPLGEPMYPYAIILVSNTNVLVDRERGKVLHTFTDPLGPYGISAGAAAYLKDYQAVAIPMTPGEFASAYTK